MNADFSALVGNRFVAGQNGDSTVEVFGAFLYEGVVRLIVSLDGGPLQPLSLGVIDLKPCPETRVQPF